MTSRNSPGEVVMSYVKALNDQDYRAARSYVSDNLIFSAPLASFNSAEEYFKDMQRLRIRFDIKKVFVDGDDVCLLYDFSSRSINLFGCGWYHVDKGKIDSLKVIYDPRPIVESLSK